MGKLSSITGSHAVLWIAQYLSAIVAIRNGHHVYQIFETTSNLFDMLPFLGKSSGHLQLAIYLTGHIRKGKTPHESLIFFTYLHGQDYFLAFRNDCEGLIYNCGNAVMYSNGGSH